jgi:peptidyl-prolyl cis-trans isomerase D
MLQQIRNVVHGWVAAVILGIIAVPFAFWGINYYFSPGGEALAAAVDDSEITLRDFQRAIQTVRQRWQEATGQAPEGEQETLLRRQTLDGLIDRRLLRSTGETIGVRIGDDQVRERIHNLEAFHGIDGFDQFRYLTALTSLNMTPVAFESQIRDDLAEDQIYSALVDSAFTTEQEVRTLARLQVQTRDFRYAILGSNEIKDGIEVTDADIENHYREHGDDYMDPERVRIAYIELSSDSIAGETTVSDGDLEAYFESNIAAYSVVEQRRIRQLLVPLPEGATDEAAVKALHRAQALRAQLADDLSMEQLSEQAPDDMPVEFSEFGFLPRGVLDAEIEEAVFALPVGEISEPLVSKVGLHIVQVMEARGGERPALDDIREQVVKDYGRADAEKRYFELAERLATLAFEHPDSLEPAAEDVELPVRETGLFSRESPGEGLTANPDVLAAAFSEEVLLQGNNSDLIELDLNHVIVLRVVEHLPARIRPLDEVRERILTRIRFERARDAMEQKGRGILSMLEQGLDPDEVAAAQAFEWQMVSGMQRDDPGVNRAILRTAFRAGRPEGGRPVFDGVSLGSGDYAVVAVTAVSDPPAETIPQEQIDAIRAELARRSGASGWTRFLAELRANSKIRIFEENLR